MTETEKNAALQLFKEIAYWSARLAEDISEEDYKKLKDAAEVLREVAKDA